MYSTKATLVLVALASCLTIAQAAGGIKGQRPEESRPQGGLKGLRPPSQQAQTQYQPNPNPQPAPQTPRPVQQQPIKGPGQVAPVFTAARVPQPQPAPAAPASVQQVIQQQEQEPEVQQQQQESEIDPNAAAQDSAPAVLAPAAPAASEEEANPRPEPYAFTYAFDAGDQATSGSSQREEQQDASGKVTGFYTLRGEDGRDRRVDYIADANGFRATISTNELGTAPKNSADVDWQAQSPSDAQLRAAESATQAARQRALLNPQPAAGSTNGAASAATPSLSKVSSPRQNVASKINQQQVAISQLQEPFEQIRQTELNARARKSRHAPFYLFTV